MRKALTTGTLALASVLAVPVFAAEPAAPAAAKFAAIQPDLDKLHSH